MAGGATRATPSPCWSPAADFRAAMSSAPPTPKARRWWIAPSIPQDLIGSILELLGIDPDAKFPNSRGLDLKVMPASDNARDADD